LRQRRRSRCTPSEKEKETQTSEGLHEHVTKCGERRRPVSEAPDKCTTKKSTAIDLTRNLTNCIRPRRGCRGAAVAGAAGGSQLACSSMRPEQECDPAHDEYNPRDFTKRSFDRTVFAKRSAQTALRSARAPARWLHGGANARNQYATMRAHEAANIEGRHARSIAASELRSNRTR
jgi:hypothetical protein